MSHSSTYHVLMSSSTLCFTKNDNMVYADVGFFKWNLYVNYLKLKMVYVVLILRIRAFTGSSPN